MLLDIVITFHRITGAIVKLRNVKNSTEVPILAWHLICQICHYSYGKKYSTCQTVHFQISFSGSSKTSINHWLLPWNPTLDIPQKEVRQRLMDCKMNMKTARKKTEEGFLGGSWGWTQEAEQREPEGGGRRFLFSPWRFPESPLPTLGPITTPMQKHNSQPSAAGRETSRPHKKAGWTGIPRARRLASCLPTGRGQKGVCTEVPLWQTGCGWAQGSLAWCTSNC